MALKVESSKVKAAETAQETQKATTSQKADAQKPVDVKKKAEVDKKATEYAEFFDSEEFKSIKNKKKAFAAFKAKFAPNLTDEEAKTLYTQAKELVTQLKQGQAEPKPATKTNETPDDKKTDGKKTDDKKTPEQTELETAAEAYMKKSKLKDMDIDQLYAHINSKTIKTKEEKELLNKIKAAYEASDNKPLVGVSEMLSKDWMSRKPEEQIAIIADKYLEKYNPEYAKATEKEKKALAQKQIETLAKSLAKSSTKLTAKDFARVPELLEALHAKKMSIEDYNKLSKEDKKALYNEHQLGMLKKIKDLIPESEKNGLKWNLMSPKRKLFKYAEAFLEKYDKDFQNLKPLEKQEYIKTKSQELLAKYVPQLSEIKDEKNKEYIIEKTLKAIDIAISSNMSLEEFNSLSMKDRLTYTKAYNEENHIKQTDVDIAYESAIENCLNNGVENPTIDDVISELENNGSSYCKDKKELNRLLNSLRLQKEISDNKNTEIDTITGKYTQLSDEEKQQAIIEDFNRLANAESREEKFQVLEEMLRKADGDIDLVNQIRDVAIENNFEEEFKAILKNFDIMAKAAARAARNDNADGFNKTIDGMKEMGPHGRKKVNIAVRMAPSCLGDESVVKVGVNVLNNHGYAISSMAEGINTYSPDPMKTTMGILSCDSACDAGKATFTRDIVITAPPERQLDYARTISTLDDLPVIEGLAAASKSVDPKVRNDYNTCVRSAAAKYPPEQQQTINRAMSTGQISAETLSRTTPPSASGNNNTTAKSTSSASNNNQAQGYASANNNSHATASSSSATPSQTAGATGTAQTTSGYATRPDATKPSGISSTGSSTVSNTGSKTTTTNQTTTTGSTASTTRQTSAQQSSEASATTGTSSTATPEAKAAEDTAAALEAKRDAAADNALATAEHIRESVAEDVKEETKNITEEIAEEYIDNNTEITPSKQAEIKEKLSNATSITEVYEIISGLGIKAQTAFFDKITKSKYVTEFIDSVSDTTILQKLYDHCGSDSTRRELLVKMTDRIFKLLDDNKISNHNLTVIDHKIIRNYLKANISSMTNDRFNMFIQYLPLDERIELTKLRNSAKGITQADETTGTATVEGTATAQVGKQKAVQKPQEPKTTDSPESQQEVQPEKPLLAANEVKKTLDDGTIITREGTTFGSIGAEQDGFRRVSPQEAGAPIGMSDTTLTPGSEEWRRKYNKQQNVAPTTAFTMASLDEEEEDVLGMPFGSNKVGMGQKIRKKYPPQGFRFNA